jgi:hypothetical protein
MGRRSPSQSGGMLAEYADIVIRSQRGGARQGAGRPPKKEARVRVTLPEDIALWLKNDQNLDRVRGLFSEG